LFREARCPFRLCRLPSALRTLNLDRHCSNFFLIFPTRDSTTTLVPRSVASSLAFSPDDPNAAQQYIYLRSAYETLNDPAKRLAYDRFGSGVDHCKTCKIESDYVWQVGFQNFWTYHLFNGAIVFVMFFLVQSADSGVRRYRIFLHALSIIMEGSLLFSGSNSGNPYVARWLGFTANQQVAILRSITMTIFVAIQHIHLVMVQIAGDPNQRGISDDPKDLRTILETVETISNIGAVETRSMFAHAFDPFKNDPQLMGQVKRKMEKTAYDMKMYEMPDVKKAYDSARTALKRSGKPVVPVKGGHAVAKR